jgi:hypothetical protein
VIALYRFGEACTYLRSSVVIVLPTLDDNLPSVLETRPVGLVVVGALAGESFKEPWIGAITDNQLCIG